MKKSPALLKFYMMEIFDEMTRLSNTFDWRETSKSGLIFRTFQVIVRSALKSKKTRLANVIICQGINLTYHTSKRAGGINEIIDELKQALEFLKNFKIDKKDKYRNRVKEYIINYFEELIQRVERIKIDWEQSKVKPIELPLNLMPIGSVEIPNYPKHLDYGVDEKGNIWIGQLRHVPVSQFCQIVLDLSDHLTKNCFKESHECNCDTCQHERLQFIIDQARLT